MNRIRYSVEITVESELISRVFTLEVEGTNPVNVLNDAVQKSWRLVRECDPDITIYHFENHVTDVQMKVTK